MFDILKIGNIYSIKESGPIYVGFFKTKNENSIQSVCDLNHTPFLVLEKNKNIETACLKLFIFQTNEIVYILPPICSEFCNKKYTYEKLV